MAAAWRARKSSGSLNAGPRGKRLSNAPPLAPRGCPVSPVREHAEAPASPTTSDPRTRVSENHVELTVRYRQCAQAHVDASFGTFRTRGESCRCSGLVLGIRLVHEELSDDVSGTASAVQTYRVPMSSRCWITSGPIIPSTVIPASF
jgi:hypothetical protein